MISEVLRIAALGLAFPLGTVWGAWHRLLTSKHAIVDVTVEKHEDGQARDAWLQGVRHLAEDDHVEAVVFTIDAPPGGYAACQDLRAAIGALKAAGKSTIAFIDAPGNAGFWIASACDRVFCVPTGELNLLGVGVEMTFFGAALEHLGVRPDFEAAGAYKSFGEPFTRSFASPHNLEAMELLIGDLHRQLVEDIAADRELPPETVQALLERAPLAAEEAVVDGLVDQLLYDDQLTTWLEEQHGEAARRVDFDKWRVRDNIQRRLDRLGQSSGAIAVLHLDGNIVMDDKGPRTLIRARTVAPILKDLREDDDVKAVVLHVNSPGGSALASDILWREVDQLGREKPVVACFEDVAASGGYYLSAPAKAIFARPGTLTGSIGVFGGKLVAAEGLRKVGITTQPVTAAPNANLFSASKRFTDAQRVRFRQMLQRFYDGFVDRVAKGRNTSEDVIEPHCRGRVWTGTLAKERNLVDQTGTLDDAIAHAQELAGLKRFQRRDVSGQPKRNPLQQLLRDALSESVPQLAQVRLARSVFDRMVAGGVATQLEHLAEHEGQAMALLPFGVELS
jgi:protease-4